MRRFFFRWKLFRHELFARHGQGGFVLETIYGLGLAYQIYSSERQRSEAADAASDAEAEREAARVAAVRRQFGRKQQRRGLMAGAFRRRGGQRQRGVMASAFEAPSGGMNQGRGGQENTASGTF